MQEMQEMQGVRVSKYMGKGKSITAVNGRFKTDDCYIDDFVFGITSRDTNGQNIKVLSGVVSDLIKEVNRLTKVINEMESNK